MIRYFNKKITILFFLSTLFLLIESFISIVITDFINALLQMAVYKGEITPPGISNEILGLYKLGKVWLPIVTVLVSFVGILFGFLGVWLSVKWVMIYSAQMRLKAYKKIQNFSFQDIDKFSTSSLVTRLTTDVELASTSFVFASIFVASGFFSIIYGIVKSVIQYSQWVFIYGYVIPAIFVIIFIIAGFAMPNMKKGQIDIDGINNQTRESILGIRVIKAYNLEQKQKNKFEKPNEALAKSWYKGYSLLGLLPPIIQGIITGMIVILYYVSYTNYENIAGAANLIGFIGIVLNVLFGFMILLVSITQISRSIPSIKRINEVTSYEPTLKYDDSSTKKIEKGIIEFKNISHSYLNDNEHKVLKNINLKINSKERIGIIGTTGSGKSTLVNLLSRLFDPTEGEVLIDGINVKDFSFNEINSKVALAMQTAILFSGTIRTNIAFGLPDNLKEDQLEEEIIKAAKASEAWEFISKKDQQLDSIVEQRGKNFSGGQKQRISIARTIAKKSKIVIFDDSTSALDTITERKVQQNIRNYNDATTIIVAQRISSVEELDKIIVMKNGEVVGFDSHLNLLANNDVYRSIAASQLGTEELNEFLKEHGLKQIEKKDKFEPKNNN